MAGFADLLFGGGAQAYAGPDPSTSMADILAGGVSAAAPSSSGGSVATAFADSPAPGAVASAGAQANAAAAQEPGIMDRARNWATTNPVQAQALMQGFAALASGRTRGGFLQQMGQAAGVANQTMVEQNSANAEQQRAQAVRDRDFNLRQEDSQDQRANRAADNSRADKQLTMQGEQWADQRLTSEEARATSREKRGEAKELNPLKLKEARLRLAELQEKINAAPDERTARKLKLDLARLEFQNYEKFGSANAQAEADKARYGAQAAASKADQEELQLEQAELSADEIAKLSPEERKNLRLGIKPPPPKIPKTGAEIADSLLLKQPDQFYDQNGNIKYKELTAAVKAVQNAGAAPPPADDQQAGFDAALAQAKPGATFQYNGRTFRKPK